MTDKTKTTDSNIRAQMRKGILEYCVLLLLSRQRAYPSDIINGLSEASLIVVEGTLYTLLNRLRKEGKLNYEWEESPKRSPPEILFHHRRRERHSRRDVGSMGRDCGKRKPFQEHAVIFTTILIFPYTPSTLNS